MDTTLAPGFSPSGPTRPRWQRSLLAPIAAAHVLLLWAFSISMPEAAHPSVTTPLAVRLITPESTAIEPPAIRTPEAAAAPRPAWMPIPEVTNFVVPTPSLVATPSDPVAAPPTAAVVAIEAVAPAASVATIARAVPVERQIAISQVEYLSPPLLNYPLSARRLREQGQVQVRVRVDEQGRPERFVVLRSSGSERLDEAALATVRATRFKPYREDGVARPFWVVMPLVFELDT